MAGAIRETARLLAAGQTRAERAGRLNEVVAVREDDGGELGVDVELVEDRLDVVANGHGGDEELLGDGRSRQAMCEAAKDLFLPAGQIDRVALVRGHRPERL